MRKSVQRVLAVAQVTFMDGMRKHALIGLIALALLLEVFGIVFMDFFGRDVGRASSDFLISIIWLAGMVFLLFHAVQTIAMSEEQKVIYIFLSRPISRSEYVVGIFVGLALLLFVLQVLLGVVSYVTLLWMKTQLETQYFPVFNQGYFVLSIVGVFVMQLCVLAAIMVFCGVLRGSFLVLMMSIAYYSICSGIPVVLESLKQQMIHIEQGYSSYYLLKAIGMLFPDFSRLDFKDFVVMPSTPMLADDVGLSFIFSVVYALMMLMLACYLYRRRDL